MFKQYIVELKYYCGITVPESLEFIFVRISLMDTSIQCQSTENSIFTIKFCNNTIREMINCHTTNASGYIWNCIKNIDSTTQTSKEYVSSLSYGLACGDPIAPI